MRIATRGKPRCNWVKKIRVMSKDAYGTEYCQGVYDCNVDNKHIVEIPCFFTAKSVKLIPIEFNVCIDFKADILVQPV